MSRSHAFAILRILGDGAVHSGEEIAETLGCSRTLVWQAVRMIKQDFSLMVYCVRGHGYRLTEAIEWLEVAQVRAALSPAAADTYLLTFSDQTDSTNTQLMQRAADGAPHGLVLGCEWQNAARGRLGRRWQMKLGGTLAFSILWRFNCGLGDLSGLSLAVGVAIVRVLRNLQIPAMLKWPNDVLLDGKKLAGILIELTGDALGPVPVVIGIGLNLSLPDNVDQPTACLPQDADLPGRNRLLAQMLNSLHDVLNTFHEQGFAALRSEWESYCSHHNQPITLILPHTGPVQGVARGVDNQGALLIDTATGLHSYQIGEVSLRMGHTP